MKKIVPLKKDWPKKPVTWIENRTRFTSIPFTWNLPAIHDELKQLNIFYDRAIVGGPAVHLMPNFFAELPHVTTGMRYDGVLQRINPTATRTTTGCIRRCKFCAVRKIEGSFRTLADWPDLPILCDNNLLAAPMDHIVKVITRLQKWIEPDFNQGLDVRLLTEEHAMLIGTLRRPIVRLAFDSPLVLDAWDRAYNFLRKHRVPKRSIRSYVLIGYDSGPHDAWYRCQLLEEGYGIKPNPLWFHSLDALDYNTVTKHQKSLGWDDSERKRIMQYYYQHRASNENRKRRKDRSEDLF